MTTLRTKELKVFYCYARRDQDLRDQLERHLSNLKRIYRLETWFDRQISPGDNWETVIDKHLKMADIILFLISPDFMASDYCYSREMQQALEMHVQGTAKVIPILLRWVHWKNAPFSHIQMLPADAQPVKDWADLDAAFYNIAVGIEKVIQSLLTLQEVKEEQIQEDKNLIKRAAQNINNNSIEIVSFIDIRGNWQEVTDKHTRIWSLVQSGDSITGRGTHKSLYHTNPVALTGLIDGYDIRINAYVAKNDCTINYSLHLNTKQTSMRGEWESSCNGEKGEIELCKSD